MKHISLFHIAGYCSEVAIWKMIADICGIVQGQDIDRTFITPESVIVDGSTFYLDDKVAIPELLPPEYLAGEPLTESQQVWMLGASIYYASSGRILFGGKGGPYQRDYPHVQLPVLQKAHQTITPIMQRCLQYYPSQRIEVRELKDIALHEWELCCQAPRPQVVKQKEEIKSIIIDDQKWPEEMAES